MGWGGGWRWEAGEARRWRGPGGRGGRATNNARGPGLQRRGRKQEKNEARREEGTRRGRRSPRPSEERGERAEGEALGAAGLRASKWGPLKAPPRLGPTWGGGPGPSRAPSRLTQWPRHAGRACTCSKRLLADMALGSSRVATAADSPHGGGGSGWAPATEAGGAAAAFVPDTRGPRRTQRRHSARLGLRLRFGDALAQELSARLYAFTRAPAPRSRNKGAEQRRRTARTARRWLSHSLTHAEGARREALREGRGGAAAPSGGLEERKRRARPPRPHRLGIGA